MSARGRRGTRSPVERQDPPARIGFGCAQIDEYRRWVAEHDATCAHQTHETAAEKRLREAVGLAERSDDEWCQGGVRDSVGNVHKCVLKAHVGTDHTDGELHWRNP